MAVLETMAGINAAYSIIKKTLENGRELHDCASAISNFAVGKSDVEAHHKAEQNSFWNKLAGKDASDLASFMHQEKVRRMEENLREYMQLYGRGGMWSDYQKYCAEARKQRLKAKEDKIKARKKLIDIITKSLLGVFISFVVISAIVMGYLVYTRGML